MKKWLANLKIGYKITLGFIVVAIMSSLVGAAGFWGVNIVANSYYHVTTSSVSLIEELEIISSTFKASRTDLSNLVLAEEISDKEKIISDYSSKMKLIKEKLMECIDIQNEYSKNTGFDVGKNISIIQELQTAFEKLKKETDSFINSPAAMVTARRKEAINILAEGGIIHETGDEIDNLIYRLISSTEEIISEAITSNNYASLNTKVAITIGATLANIFAVLIGIWIARNISKRIKTVADAAAKLAEGNTDIDVTVDVKDETGLLAMTFIKMSDMLRSMIGDVRYILGEFAKGNFAVNSENEELYIGDYRDIIDNLHTLKSNLSVMLRNISLVAEQVESGSSQVSSGAQALAAGSTEQAASIQELSASIEKVAEQADENLAIVEEAARLIEQAGAGVASGNSHMVQLTSAMDDIGEASDQIASISKVIEDIAFQTNILALNAAIEAARAGAAGKGFAVVADEVRNLAAKSQDAAKKTSELIQNTVETVSRGTELTSQTAEILMSVQDSTLQVVESFINIERSSSEQKSAIEQVREGLSQISGVVQTNAATAEENSATSEEMFSQAVVLREEVSHFTLEV